MPVASDLLKHALAKHHSGDPAGAASAYAAVIAAEPHNVDALQMFGLLKHQQGEVDEALRLLSLALSIAPANPAVLSNRAGVYLAQGDYVAAARDALLATQFDPDSAGAWMNLGLALDGRKQTAAAASALARASALRPQNARMLLAWFSAAARGQQPAGLAQRSRRPPPKLASERLRALRTARELEQHGYSNQSLYLLSQLRVELPEDAEIAQWLALELRFRQAAELEQGQDIASALSIADALLDVAPWHRGARMLRASILSERGEASQAAAEYRRIVDGVADDAVAGDAYLIALQYDPDVGADELARRHREWADRHMPAIAAHWNRQTQPADAESALHIGWLSPRFFGGLAATFFLPVLQKFDRTLVQHTLYDSGGIDDETTARFRHAADAWRDVSALDDAALCAAIRADGIDILVEMSGHGPGNQLRALAARPAPVQVSWFDYFHSTGTRAIDVLLSDAVLSPPDDAAHYSERVLNLPSGRLCYSAPVDAPPVVARAADAPLRFACFNRPAKINQHVLATWARILEYVPDSQIKLKARAFDAAQARGHFLERCARVGIAADRIQFTGHGSHTQTLAAYADVDIALDTFPFSGCATSCDALWMGVPVITLRGQTMVSRQTASLLTCLDLAQFIGVDSEHYIRCAVALAADAPRRCDMRQGLRPRMLAQLGNVERHARELEGALDQAWRDRPDG